MPKKLSGKKTLGHPIIVCQDGKPVERTYVYGKLSKTAKAGADNPTELRIFGRMRLVSTPEGPRFKLQGPAIRTTPDFDEEGFWGPILARLMLGQEMYEDVGLNATARDVEHAHSIIKEIAYALLSGERAVLDRLSDVEHVVHGRPTNEAQRLALYRERFADSAATYQAITGGEVGITREEWLTASIANMAERHDPAFAKLAPHQLDKAYRSISEKRGPGQIGPLRAAAEMAVEAEAFGTTKTDDFEADVQRTMSRMRKATNDAKRGAAAKKALPRT